MPKIDAFYLYSSYMYIIYDFSLIALRGHLEPCLQTYWKHHSFTLYKVYINFHLWHFYWYYFSFSCHSAKCAIPPSLPFSGLYLNYMKNIQVWTEHLQELCPHRTQKYKFLYKTAGCQSSTEVRVLRGKRKQCVPHQKCAQGETSQK